MAAKLNLIVIRSPDAARLAGFYQTLGLVFELHRHGSDPEHFASENGSCVFEIYPASSEATSGLRLGFEVQDVSYTVQLLINSGATVLKAPSPSPWGLRAVLQDPDGNKLELTQPSSTSSLQNP